MSAVAVIPPPPVPYQFDPADHSIRVQGEASHVVAAIEHLRLRAPRLASSPSFVLPGAGVALLIGAVGVRMLGALFLRQSPGLSALVSLAMLVLIGVGLVLLVVGVIRMQKKKLTVVDPSVPRTVHMPDPPAMELIRALPPGVHDVTVQFFKPSLAGTEPWRSYGLIVRAPAGSELSVWVSYQVKISVSGRTKTTTTSYQSVFTARPAQMPPDIVARIGSVGPGSFPTFPNMAPTEISVKEGRLNMNVQSRDAPVGAQLAAYANTLGHVAGFAAPPFRA